MEKTKQYQFNQSGCLFHFWVYDGRTIKEQTTNETDAKTLCNYLDAHGYILANN